MPNISPRGVLLEIYHNNVWNKVSDHNRSPIVVNVQRIEKSQRMANGTMRKFFIADKKSFSISWTMLPSYSTLTVDGGWGAENIRDFYQSTVGKGAFNINLNFALNGAASQEPYTVVFTDCSFTLVKRGAQAHWDVSITMEEV